MLILKSKAAASCVQLGGLVILYHVQFVAQDGILQSVPVSASYVLRVLTLLTDQLNAPHALWDPTRALDQVVVV